MLPKIIAVEGPDGVGKSTFCAALTSTLEGKALHIKTPPGELFHYARQAGTPGSLGAFFAFMLGNSIVSQMESDKNWLILDRYVLSTFVYHAEAIAGSKMDFRGAMTGASCRSPYITVLLECSLETVARRLSERDEVVRPNFLLETNQLQKSFQRAIGDARLSSCMGHLLLMQNESETDLATNVVRVAEIAREIDMEHRL